METEPMNSQKVISGTQPGVGKFAIYSVDSGRDYAVIMSIDSDRAAGIVEQWTTNKGRAFEIVLEHGFSLGVGI